MKYFQHFTFTHFSSHRHIWLKTISESTLTIALHTSNIWFGKICGQAAVIFNNDHKIMWPCEMLPLCFDKCMVSHEMQNGASSLCHTIYWTWRVVPFMFQREGDYCMLFCIPHTHTHCRVTFIWSIREWNGSIYSSIQIICIKSGDNKNAVNLDKGAYEKNKGNSS